jgi:D-aspartate ligase
MTSTPHVPDAPLACVLGDLSMVRPLGRCGIPVALGTQDPAAPMARSRYCRTVLALPSWVAEPDRAIETLIDWGRRQAHKPVLFYQGDHDMVAVSRARERLAEVFRFVLPSAQLVEALSDKFLFADLASQRDLPVPRTLRIYQGQDYRASVRTWDTFPAVLKPSMRTEWFERVGSTQKALRVQSRADLEQAWQLLGGNDLDLLLQAAVEGGEEQIVSYHAYVRPDGSLAAEFTGRKIRTSPRLYGMSSHVQITDDPEVLDLGRSVVRNLNFTGVLKIDFKIDVRDRQLYLLEINPRFNLWHHPATVAGLPIPALVYRDCIGQGGAANAATARVRRAGVRWVDPMLDRAAYRGYRDAGELSFPRWLGQLLTADVNEGFSWRDPAPGLVSLRGRVGLKLSRWLGRTDVRNGP